MQNRPLFSSDYRRIARAAMRINLPTLVMLVFIASLPGLLSEVFRTLMMPGYLTEQALNLQAVLQSSTSYNEIMDAFTRTETILNGFIASPAWTFICLASLATALVTPVLSLGMEASLIRHLRGEQVEPRDVLCRMNIFLRALWLEILTGLKVFLWCLPGIAVTLMSAFSVLYTHSLGTMVALYFAGLVLTIALAVRALLHYALASQILADHPEMKAGAAIKASVDCMRTRKGRLFALGFSFIGWQLLCSIVQMTASSIWSVLGLVVGLAGSLAISLYINTAFAAFYLNEYCGSVSEPAAPEKNADKSI